MKRIYIAHPYGGLEENKLKVEDIIINLVKENDDVLFISPIHALGFLYQDVSYEKGMEYCLDLLESCDEIWLCKGWKDSKGCNMEYEFAVKNCIPYYFIF